MILLQPFNLRRQHLDSCLQGLLCFGLLPFPFCMLLLQVCHCGAVLLLQGCHRGAMLLLQVGHRGAVFPLQVCHRGSMPFPQRLLGSSVPLLLHAPNLVRLLPFGLCRGAFFVSFLQHL